MAEAGGRLIVSPDTNAEVIAETSRLGLESWPGVMTPTECFAALRAGADWAEAVSRIADRPGRAQGDPRRSAQGLPGLCRRRRGPSRTLRAWIAAGANGFGIGTALYTPGLSAAEVATRARTIIAAWEAAR